MVRRHLRSVVWRSLDGTSAQFCTLRQDNDEGRLLEGTVVLTFGDDPGAVSFRIVCDSGWNTRLVEIEVRAGAQERQLRLSVDEQQRWSVDGEEMPLLRGHRDVDLAVSPLTNTLPIRRLGLVVGEAADVTAVWVGFPDLAIELLEQRYTRTSDRQYHYASEGDFMADLDVDELGIVERYTGGWERIATG